MDDETVMIERWIACVSLDWSMKPGAATQQYKYCKSEQEAKDFVSELCSHVSNPCQFYAVLEHALLHQDSDNYHRMRIDVLNAEQNLVREGKLTELADMPIDMSELSDMQEALTELKETVQ